MLDEDSKFNEEIMKKNYKESTLLLKKISHKKMGRFASIEVHGEKLTAIQNIVLDEHNDLADVYEKLKNKQKRDKMEKTKSMIPIV